MRGGSPCTSEGFTVLGSAGVALLGGEEGKAHALANNFCDFVLARLLTRRMGGVDKERRKSEHVGGRSETSVCLSGRVV